MNIFKKLSFLAPLFIFCLTFILISCTKQEKLPSDQDLYNQGMKYMEKRKYREAEEKFKRLEDEHPESSLMAKTRLNRADSLYQIKEFDLAREEYENFLNLHPLHPNTDFARFRIAMTFFKQILSIDRDQSFTIKALETFERFLKEYPQSELTTDAKEKISECRLRLLEHDLYVARYYLKTGSYRSARGRLRQIWELYPEMQRNDEVLYLLYKTYQMEGMTDEAKNVLSGFCKEFPNSPFIKKIQGACQREEIKALQ